MELSAPTTALEMNRAITSPLMNRKAVFGLSRSRRPAMSVAGRPARFTMRREPAVVNHGPASTRPVTRSAKPTSSSSNWLPTAPGLPGGVEVRQAKQCRQASGMSRNIRGGRLETRRVTPSGEICTRRSARRADTTAASGTPIKAIAMSTNVSERSPVCQGRSRKRARCTAAVGPRRRARNPPPPPPETRVPPPPPRPPKSDAV